MKKYLSLLISLVLLLSLVSSCMSSETITVTSEPITQTITETQVNTLTETKVMEKNTTLTTITTITYNPYKKDYDVYDPAYLEKGSFKLGKSDLVDYYVIDGCKYIKLYDSELLEKLELYEAGDRLSDEYDNMFDLVNYVGAFDNIIRVKQIKETQSSSLPLVCLDDIMNCFSHLIIEEDKIVVKNELSDYCEYGDHIFNNDGRYCDKCGWDRVWGLTMTTKEIKSLVGQDPEIIAEKIKTAGDCGMYAYLNFNPDHEITGTPQYQNYTKQEFWGFSLTGYDVITLGYPCCCGGGTNYCGYVLDGDYEEVGVIQWKGIDNNHTIAYVKCNGKYYTVDVTYYNSFAADISYELDDLNDFVDMVNGFYFDKDIIIFCRSNLFTGQYHTNYLSAAENINTMDMIMIFTPEANGQINLLYDNKNRSAEQIFKYKECTIPVMGWNCDPYVLNKDITLTLHEGMENWAYIQDIDG